MNKSVLIMDTPECCAECDFYNDISAIPWCMAAGKEVGFTFNANNEKMNDCSLVPLEKVCDMAIKAHKKEERARKENRMICTHCLHYFDLREAEKDNRYSKWFHDVDGNGIGYDWHYVYHDAICPDCGGLVLINYETERR